MTTHTEDHIKASSSEASTSGAAEGMSFSRSSLVTIKENNVVSTSTGSDTFDIDDTIKEDINIRNRYSKQSIHAPREENSYFCRICHALGSRRRLLSPCLCRGSISLVHKRCLERWLAESDTNVCEICGFEYNIERRLKYSWLGSLWAWFISPRNGEKRKLLLLDLSAGVLLLLISYACSIFGGRALVYEPPPNNNVNPPQTLIATRIIQTFIISSVIVLNMGVVAWTVYRFQYHFRDWHSWYRRHCIVILQGYAEDEPERNSSLGKLAHASSTSSSTSARVIVF